MSDGGSASPGVRELQAGDQLDGGRYEVLSELGRGGFGTVYLGIEVRLDRKVVVKVPHRNLLADPGFAARFEAEMVHLAGLEHPGIVPIFGSGNQNGLPYAVVRYLAGGDLKERVRRQGGTQTPREVFDWLAGLAEALDFMHARDVIHRDIKPDNILFDKDDRPYLSDFGLAKATADTETGDPAQTRTGMFVGSPPYIAPEYVDRNFGPACDQYSLAVVVYEALSSERPHEGPTTERLLVNKVALPPAPLAPKLPGWPSSMCDVVMRALEPEPGNRFSSCTAFARAFGDAVDEVERQATLETSDGAFDDHSTLVRPPPKPGYDDETLRPDPQPHPVEEAKGGDGKAAGPSRWLGAGVALLLLALALVVADRWNVTSPEVTEAPLPPSPSAQEVTPEPLEVSEAPKEEIAPPEVVTPPPSSTVETPDTRNVAGVTVKTESDPPVATEQRVTPTQVEPPRVDDPRRARVVKRMIRRNKASRRTQPLLLELEMRNDWGDVLAEGELYTHPTGLARLELQGAGGLVERHLLTGGSHLSSRNGLLLARARALLPPLFLMQADSASAMDAALEAFRVERVTSDETACGRSPCWVLGGPGEPIEFPEQLAALRGSFANVRVYTHTSEILAIETESGVRTRFQFEKGSGEVRVPSWITIEEPGERSVRFHVKRAVAADVPARAYSQQWLLEPEADSSRLLQDRLQQLISSAETEFAEIRGSRTGRSGCTMGLLNCDEEFNQVALNYCAMLVHGLDGSFDASVNLYESYAKYSCDLYRGQSQEIATKRFETAMEQLQTLTPNWKFTEARSGNHRSFDIEVEGKGATLMGGLHLQGGHAWFSISRFR